MPVPMRPTIWSLPLVLCLPLCWHAESAAAITTFGGESWMVCGKQYQSKKKADKALKSCEESDFTCEKVAARGIVSLRRGRLPGVPRNGFDGPYGTVYIRIEFDEQGKYLTSEVLNSPSDQLSEFATDAARTWEVYPSCPEGVPARQSGRIPMVFSP